MSTLIRPVVIEPCQTTLRGRRRSSIRPLEYVPGILAQTSPTPEGPAVSDDVSAGNPQESRSSGIHNVHTLAPTKLPVPSNAHLPDLATKITIPRHFDTSLSPLDISTPITSPITSPATSPPATPRLSRDPSFAAFLPEDSVHIKSRRPERLKWRLAAGFFTFLLFGWGDGVTATVIPYLMTDYHLSTMTLSLLYLGTTVGFVIGTLTVEPFLDFLGRFNFRSNRSWLIPTSSRLSKFTGEKLTNKDVAHSPSQARFLALMLGCFLNASFFALMASHTGFPTMFVAYVVAAFAKSLWTAPLNAYFAQGPKQSMGVSYGLSSFGSVSAPFVAQSLISGGTPWPHFYYGSLVICALNFGFLLLTYRPTMKELVEERRIARDGMQTAGNHLPEATCSATEDGSYTPIPTAPVTSRPENTLRIALSIPRQWALLAVSMLYTGSETCAIVFMVTFLLDARHANRNSAGFVTSGFWGGITVGRFLWGYVSPRVSYTKRKYIVQVSICVGSPGWRVLTLSLVIAVVMHLVIWLTANVFGDAFCASLVGLLYGPVFPAMLSMATDILPGEVHLISMALISMTSSIGGALFPFVLGTVIKIKGPRALNYINVPLGVVLAILWAFLPSRVPSSLFLAKK